MCIGNSFDWFELAKFIVEIVLTVVAVTVSIVALWQTKRQIQLSNKQALFDHRLKAFSAITELHSIFRTYYKKNNSDCIDEEFIKRLIDLLMVTPDLQVMIDEKRSKDENDLSKHNTFFALFSELIIKIGVVFDKKDGHAVLVSSYMSSIFRLLNYGTGYLSSLSTVKKLQEDKRIISEFTQEPDLADESSMDEVNQMYNKFVEAYHDTVRISNRVIDTSALQELQKQLVLNR